MEITTPIPMAVDGCARNFLSLVDRLEVSSRFSDQVSAGLIADEFDRLKLWAGNIAAHRKGRRSLQNRLRDAPQLRADTLEQLGFLSDTQKQALAIVEGLHTPWDELTYSDDDAEFSDSENDKSDVEDQTELKQLYSSIKTAISSLMRISLAIREPAQAIQPRSIDKSHFEEFDGQHVRDKFPNAPSYLCERLGFAITSRRRYLTYREEHHEKLASGIAKLGYEAPKTEFTTNSTEATKLHLRDDMMDEGEDAVSTTSFATSVNATVRAPALPREAREKEHYTCPFCYDLVAIHNRAEWKRHVYQDLHPYCCTFENCATADRLFVSRHAWFAHELEAHYSSFQCVDSCSKVFRTECKFRDHVKSNHQDLAAPDVYSALKNTSIKTAAQTEVATCCLCYKQMTLRGLQKHLGHHQEQLALFALPNNLDESEDDQEKVVENDSLAQHKMDDEEGATDTSDASDGEETYLGEIDEDTQSTTRTPETQREAGSKTAVADPELKFNEYGDSWEIPRVMKFLRSKTTSAPGVNSEPERNVPENEWERDFDSAGQIAKLEQLLFDDKNEEMPVEMRVKDFRRMIANVRRARSELKAQAAKQTAFDAHDQGRDEEEAEAETERQTALDEAQDEQQREEMLYKSKEGKALRREDELFKALLRKRKEKEAKQKEEDKEPEDTMRNRLAHFGFQEDRIDAMVHSDKQKGKEKQDSASTTHDPLRVPTYAKVSKQHLDIETLHYYDVPYEYDADPSYLILLREMSQEETNILFEHTRGLRSNRSDRPVIQAEGSE